MPRLKLKPLTAYAFHADMIVRTTDLNYGGHLGNDKLLSLIHEARVAFLSHHGFSELDCGGVSLIMGDAAIMYKAEAYAGDLLRFEVAAKEPGRSGFRLFYRITRLSDNSLIALVENGMACFDYQAKKLASVPTTVLDMCGRPAADSTI